jgi:tRNA modification GTPase
MRAFLAGKRDLPRAEAVQAVIAAGSRDELKQALAQLAGGVTRPLEGLRDDLLNLLADVEAGLDFTEEDITFVEQKDMLLRLTKGMAQLTTLKRQLEQRSAGERPFRVVLVGEPNAGKSSLFNALGGATALVSPEPGTTRDYLRKRLNLDGVVIELIDTAGWQPAGDEIDEQSQSLGVAQARAADLLLVCSEKGTFYFSERVECPIFVATKCDIIDAPEGVLATSAVTGAGLDELKALLAEHARRCAPALAPSLSRCRHLVDAALESLRRVHAVVLFEDPPEVLALELRGTLDQLGAITGAVHTDDLLDRIFSRFCIGK